MINPNKWHSTDGTDTVDCRGYKVTILTPDECPRGKKTWARLRLDYGLEDNTHKATGEVDFGEVEDFPIFLAGSDFGDAPDPHKGLKGRYPTCYSSHGAMHVTAGLYEWLGSLSEIITGDSCIQERRVSWENDADDLLDEDSISNLIPEGCCDSICVQSDLDSFDDGSDIGGMWFEEGILYTTKVAIATSGEKAARYAYDEHRDSLLFVNLFIDWTHDGDWDDIVSHHGAGEIVPEHIIFVGCRAIAPTGMGAWYGDGLVNSFPDNKIVVNPNKWHSRYGEDTLTCRVYEVDFVSPDTLPYGISWARWRLDYGEEINTHESHGPVDFGEVEDYPVGQGNKPTIYELVPPGCFPSMYYTYFDSPILDRPWRYDYQVEGMPAPVTETITGVLNFRSVHPELDDSYVDLTLHPPCDSTTDWHQAVTIPLGAAVVTGFSLTGPPWEHQHLSSLPQTDWQLPVIAPTGLTDVPDTVFTAVNLGLYYDSNPLGFNGGDWAVGQTLSDLDITIVDGRADGLQGILFATSAFALDPESEIGFTPIGGEVALLNSLEYPMDLVIIEGKAASAPHAVTSPTIKIEKTHNTYQGTVEDVSVVIENTPLEMGGFDFLIAYDASALSFTGAEKGQLLEDCGWEYFTYRHGVAGNCEGGCPSGLLRIIAIADLDNGPTIHPSCSGPPDTDAHELARMGFYVTEDLTFEGQYIPIKFYWADCGDNAISSVDGNITYLDRAIYSFTGNLLWDEDDDDEFPEDARPRGLGAPDACLEGGGPDKPQPLRFVDYWFGGIDIIPRDSLDAPGDINLNGINNEIADVVLFSNYFIYGDAVWDPPYMEGQIAATDVNMDGVTLTIADLVYLIRIITGDETPFPKLVPQESQASVSWRIGESELLVDWTSRADAGGVLLAFDHHGAEFGEPILGEDASGMKTISHNNGAQLRVLIYGMERDAKIAAGDGTILRVPIITSDPGLVLGEAEAADYWGNMMTVSIARPAYVPRSFALFQNIPNPFNATTRIDFNLPDASDVTLIVYDVLGRRVATLVDGHFESGRHHIEWDARDDSGHELASGVYFYRIVTTGRQANRKMVLLK